jgi:hypothetical protein
MKNYLEFQRTKLLHAVVDCKYIVYILNIFTCRDLSYNKLTRLSAELFKNLQNLKVLKASI